MSIKAITALLRALKSDIGDEYRCSDDPDDDTPGMIVTVATTDGSDWSYQTGDNSYSGACYGYLHWSVIYLYRRSNCRDLAREAVAECMDAVAEEKQSAESRLRRDQTIRAFSLWCLPDGRTEQGSLVRTVHPQYLPLYYDI